ncbi:iron-sulfur cluster-binding protein, partial [Pseudomonas syringae pv. actinidiae ICMP 19070]
MADNAAHRTQDTCWPPGTIMTELIRLLPDVDLIRSIDALLPQTQCGKCGHSG